eukprot:TRINITY_DN6267_c0_g1_i3.p1 TRINITY_DN6267_c0_g1~~TRINITY_DN6267_c0_g1_i3.p1  ORF type:complete len:459 (+),score=91.20 TRINITY_DN6267_c0_g1_i3:47-1423(+)
MGNCWGLGEDAESEAATQVKNALKPPVATPQLPGNVKENNTDQKSVRDASVSPQLSVSSDTPSTALTKSNSSVTTTKSLPLDLVPFNPNTPTSGPPNLLGTNVLSSDQDALDVSVPSTKNLPIPTLPTSVSHSVELEVATTSNSTFGHFSTDVSNIREKNLSTGKDLSTTGDEDILTTGYKDTSTGNKDISTTDKDLSIAEDKDISTTGKKDISTAEEKDISTTGDKDISTTGDRDISTTRDEDISTTGDKHISNAKNQDLETPGNVDIFITSNSGTTTAISVTPTQNEWRKASKEILGNWRDASSGMALRFKEDGTFSSYQIMPKGHTFAKYTLDESTSRISFHGDSDVITNFNLGENTLSLTVDKEPINFTRWEENQILEEFSASLERCLSNTTNAVKHQKLFSFAARLRSGLVSVGGLEGARVYICTTAKIFRVESRVIRCIRHGLHAIIFLGGK